jgi:uncharacterized glyoxalase superfamily protein PhnB
MKPTPPGWPRISTSLYYDDASGAIDWLCKAFGFEVHIKVVGEGGRIDHSELLYGGGLIMVGSIGDASRRPEAAHRKSPTSIGGANTQNMFVYVDDVDAHCERARAAGGKIVMEPTTNDHGADYWTDRTYEVVDIGGHHWWFGQRLRTGRE